MLQHQPFRKDVTRHSLELGQVSAVAPILQPSVGEAILKSPCAEAEKSKPTELEEDDYSDLDLDSDSDSDSRRLGAITTIRAL
jgi:hypothetical protein